MRAEIRGLTCLAATTSSAPQSGQQELFMTLIDLNWASWVLMQLRKGVNFGTKIFSEISVFQSI
jgi:hypothetical protein